MALKVLETSDMNDPAQHFAWALSLVPGIGVSGAGIPAAWGEAISEHLHELGFRHHAELQTKKFARPYRGQQSQYNTGGKWVPMDTVLPDPMVIPDVEALTPQEREGLLSQFRARGDIAEPEPVPDMAAEFTFGEL